MTLDCSLMLTQPLTSRYLPFTLPYLTLPYLTLPYLTLPYLTLPYPTADSEGEEEDHDSGGKKQVLGTTLDLCWPGLVHTRSVDI